MDVVAVDVKDEVAVDESEEVAVEDTVLVCVVDGDVTSQPWNVPSFCFVISSFSASWYAVYSVSSADLM